MSRSVRIRCINKRAGTSADERIEYVGGVNYDGTIWKLSVGKAIAGMKNGTWRFWTAGPERSTWVVIARSPAGEENLKAELDGEIPTHLLSLPECPPAVREISPTLRRPEPTRPSWERRR